ncbi:MAG: hypothetical protein QM817_42355 [Archangium sp.]
MDRFVLAAVTAAAFFSCATPQGASSLATENFPSRESVKGLTARPVRLDVAKISSDVVDSWELAGPFPQALGAINVQPTTDWEKELATVAPSTARAFTEDHRCIAREIARYYASRKQYPGHSLQRFIELRCATTADRVAFKGFSGTVPAGMSDADWFAQAKGSLAKMGNIGNPELVGIAAARDGERGAVVIVTGEAGAIFPRPVPNSVAGMKSIELRGKMAHGSALRLEARINQGALESVGCRTLDAASPPEFAFTCDVAPGDTRTVVEVAAFDEGRLFGRKVVDLVVWPTAAPTNTWSRAKGSSDVPTGLLASRFVSEVNALRTRAGLPSLTEVPEQSATATLLAPHYFASQFGQTDPLEADAIALAMMAGWDVGLDIVSSGFGSSWLSGTRDLALFVEFLLDSPFQRFAVTDKRATHIAVGTFEDPTSLAALFATYVPLGTFDRPAAETAVITRLNTLRRDRGLPLAQWTRWPIDEGALVAQKLGAREWTPRDASQYILQTTAGVSHGEVVGYTQLVDDLEHFQFPPEVLTRQDVNVFLSVSTYRAEEWAHTRYVVCFVLAKPGDVQTASR